MPHVNGKCIKIETNEQPVQKESNIYQNKDLQSPPIVVKDQEIRVDEPNVESEYTERGVPLAKRSIEECLKIMKSTPGNLLDALTDEECVELVRNKHVPIYKLESHFRNVTRAIELRRSIVAAKLPVSAAASFSTLPYRAYDYSKVAGSCCENVVGYVPVPLGMAGPLLIDGKYYHIPMATTEGTLVASTNRGCTALSVRFSLFYFLFLFRT